LRRKWIGFDVHRMRLCETQKGSRFVSRNFEIGLTVDMTIDLLIAWLLPAMGKKSLLAILARVASQKAQSKWTFRS